MPVSWRGFKKNAFESIESTPIQILQPDFLRLIKPFPFELVFILDVIENTTFQQFSTSWIAFSGDAVITLAQSMSDLHFLHFLARVTHRFASSLQT